MATTAEQLDALRLGASTNDLKTFSDLASCATGRDTRAFVNKSNVNIFAGLVEEAKDLEHTIIKQSSDLFLKNVGILMSSTATSKTGLFGGTQANGQEPTAAEVDNKLHSLAWLDLAE